jgi:hypothetical protein
VLLSDLISAMQADAASPAWHQRFRWKPTSRPEALRAEQALLALSK